MDRPTSPIRIGNDPSLASLRSGAVANATSVHPSLSHPQKFDLLTAGKAPLECVWLFTMTGIFHNECQRICEIPYIHKTRLQMTMIRDSVSAVRTTVLALGALGALVAATATHAQAPDRVIERIKTTGVLRIGYNPSNKPFAFSSTDGEAIGYSIDLCKRVAERLGPALGMANPVKVEYKILKSSERIPLLVEGAIDMECGASTNTLERQKSVDFSLTFFTAAGRMLIAKDKGIDDYRALNKNIRVAVVKGTTGQATLPARLSSLGATANIIETASEGEAENLLKEGKADGYVTDDVLLYAVRGKMPKPEQWEVVGKNLSIEPYGIMLPKGAKQFESLVDAALRETFSSGAILTLYDKWFQSKDFQMPLNSMTREAFKWPNKTGVGKSF
jgi:glutamate/aspartate transport system substrate-binding protein